jgi:hypothetical protein
LRKPARDAGFLVHAACTSGSSCKSTVSGRILDVNPEVLAEMSARMGGQ